MLNGAKIDAKESLNIILHELESDLMSADEARINIHLDQLKQLSSQQFCEVVQEGPRKGQSLIWILARALANGADAAFNDIFTHFNTQLPLKAYLDNALTGTDKGKSALWFLLYAAKEQEINNISALKSKITFLLENLPGTIDTKIKMGYSPSLEDLLQGGDDPWFQKTLELISHRNAFFLVLDEMKNANIIELKKLAALALQASQAGCLIAFTEYENFSNQYGSITTPENMGELEPESDFFHSPNIFQSPNIFEDPASPIFNVADILSQEWHAARNYFSVNSSFKYAKPQKNSHSFIKASNGEIFRLANKNLPNEGLLGKGGIAKAKMAFNERGEIFTVKVEGGTLVEQNADEFEIGNLRANLKGVAERKLNVSKMINGKLRDSKIYKFMTYVPGIALSEVQNTQNWPLARQICAAMELSLQVAALHCYDIIHNDIKPQNVILSFSDHLPYEFNLELIDFNISRLLRGQPHILAPWSGTEGYMAPEIKAGQPAGMAPYSKASDIYALAALFKNVFNWNDNFSQNLIFGMQGPGKRLTIEAVLNKLAKSLKELNLPHNDSIRKIMDRATVVVSGQVDIPLHIKPRTVVSDAIHGTSPYVIHLGVCWKKVNSSINFAAQTDPLWVYIGSADDREKLYFNMHSQVMTHLQLQALVGTSSLNTISEKLTYVNLLVNNLTHSEEHSANTIENNLDQKLAEYLSTLPRIDGHIHVSLDHLIAQKLLVCRHKALIATGILQYLVKHKMLPVGQVRCYRSELGGAPIAGAHGWATYRDQTTGDLWICDPRWRKVVNLSIPEGRQQSQQEYGAQTISDLIARLDYTEGFLPFVIGLNQVKGMFPVIRQISVCSSTSLIPNIHIRIELYFHGNMNEKAALRYALSASGLYFHDIQISSSYHLLCIQAAGNGKLFSINLKDFCECYAAKLKDLNNSHISPVVHAPQANQPLANLTPLPAIQLPPHLAQLFEMHGVQLPPIPPLSILPQGQDQEKKLPCAMESETDDYRFYAEEGNLEHMKAIESRVTILKLTKGVALQKATAAGQLAVVEYLCDFDKCTELAIKKANKIALDKLASAEEKNAELNNHIETLEQQDIASDMLAIAKAKKAELNNHVNTLEAIVNCISGLINEKKAKKQPSPPNQGNPILNQYDNMLAKRSLDDFLDNTHTETGNNEVISNKKPIYSPQ